MSTRIIDTQAVYDDLLGDLRRLERRLRWQEAIARLPLAMGLGFGAAAVVAAAARIWPIYTAPQVQRIEVGLFALALALNFIVAFLRPRPRIEVARRLDRALALEERISTAVDAHEHHAGGTLVALQAADAARAAHSVDLSHAFPVRIRLRDLAFSGVLAVMLLLAMFAPNPLEVAARQREAVKASQQTTAERIQQVQHEIEQAPNVDDPVRQQLLGELDALRHDLESGNLTREQALARMQQTEDNLKKLVDPATLAGKEALTRLGQELGKFSDPTVQTIANDLQLGNFDNAAQGLHDLANNLANLRPDQVTALQQALQQASQALANIDPKLAAKLAQAADALKNGKPDAAKQALDDAANQIGDAAQAIAAQQQLQKALAQVQDGEQQVAQAGQPTPGPRARATAVAGAGNGTPSAGGTPIPAAGTPGAGQSGNQASGTPGAGQSGNQASGTPGAGSQPGSNKGNPSGGNSGTNPDANQPAAGSGPGSGLSSERVYAPEPGQNPVGTPLPIDNNSNGGGGSGTGKPIGSGSGGAGTGTGPGSSTGNGSGNPPTVPYGQVYKQYSDQANSDLQNSYIPQNLKSYVRDYFTSLAPPQ